MSTRLEFIRMLYRSLLKTYDNIFPGLLKEEIPEDVKEHFRYPENLFSIQAEMYGTYHMSNLEVFYNREDFWEFPTEKYLDEDIEVEPYYITMKLDRKSTRLNSSHVAISYAVLCLKKKK